jgi:hypothetical protein
MSTDSGRGHRDHDAHRPTAHAAKIACPTSNSAACKFDSNEVVTNRAQVVTNFSRKARELTREHPSRHVAELRKLAEYPRTGARQQFVLIVKVRQLSLRRWRRLVRNCRAGLRGGVLDGVRSCRAALACHSGNLWRAHSAPHQIRETASWRRHLTAFCCKGIALIRKRAGKAGEPSIGDRMCSARQYPRA